MGNFCDKSQETTLHGIFVQVFLRFCDSINPCQSVSLIYGQAWLTGIGKSCSKLHIRLLLWPKLPTYFDDVTTIENNQQVRVNVDVTLVAIFRIGQTDCGIGLPSPRWGNGDVVSRPAGVEVPVPSADGRVGGNNARDRNAVAGQDTVGTTRNGHRWGTCKIKCTVKIYLPWWIFIWMTWQKGYVNWQGVQLHGVHNLKGLQAIKTQCNPLARPWTRLSVGFKPWTFWSEV